MKNSMLGCIIILSSVFSFCSTESEVAVKNTYFPPLNGASWETTTLESLGWNASELPQLLHYLEAKNTKGFIVLVDGKIAIERYFSNHSPTTNWYWASAGKTLTSALTGIAAQEGFLNLDEKVSTYLGNNWTNMPLAKEQLISNTHLLTMTSGIDDANFGDCVTPECLTYKADAGTRWGYHNVYVKLQSVITAATKIPFEEYFSTKLKNRIGMDGKWIKVDNNKVYTSTTRSMARFGLLFLNKGKWENEPILNANFIQKAISPSQNINKSYGYLWWINGQSSYHLPQSQYEFQGSIIPSAPMDMYMALGKNDQKIYIVPSKKMVVIRMGNAADEVNAALSDFDQVLWQYINLVIQ